MLDRDRSLVNVSIVEIPDHHMRRPAPIHASLAALVVAIELGSLVLFAPAGAASSPVGNAYPSGYSATYFQRVNASSANESALAQASFSPPSAPTWPTSANWYSYEWNVSRSGYNPNESTINRSNAGSLVRIWAQSNISEAITSSLISVNGSIYVGSWGGKFYSLNGATGAINWVDTLTSRVTGFTHGTPGHIHGGIYSTATYYRGLIYETAGTSNLSAIYPNHGTIAWCADVANNSTNPASPYYDGQVWSSPIVYGGNVYVGMSSTSDNYAFQGQVVQVSLSGPIAHPATSACKVYHPVSHVFYTIPLGPGQTTSSDRNATGGGIWGTGSADAKTNLIWISTGNCNCTSTTKWMTNTLPYWNNNSENIVALDATTLRQVYNHSFFVNGDQDFGAGPTLFYNATSRAPMVGAMNKNTTFDTMRRGSNNSAWWGNTYAQSNTGSAIAPAAYDGHLLYVADDQAQCRNGAQKAPGGWNGTIQGVNTTTGSRATGGGWEQCSNPSPGLRGQQGSVDLAGLSVADGLVFDASTTLSRPCLLCFPTNNPYWNASELEVRNSATGQVLYGSPSAQSHSYINSSIAGEPIVSDGQVYVALGNFSRSPFSGGAVEDFGLPLSAKSTIVTTSPTSAGGNWVLSGYATVAGGMPGYTCEWYWGNTASSSGCGSRSSPESTSYATLPVVFYQGNLTVIDFRGAKVVIPFNVSIASMTTGPVTSDALLVNCLAATNNSYPGLGACGGALNSTLSITGVAGVFGGISPYTYSWNYGDTSAHGTTQFVNHTYAGAGTFLVTMTGTDSHGSHAAAAVWVTVK